MSTKHLWRSLIQKLEFRKAPVYNADNLCVHNKGANFLQDERFRAAYNRGMFSGHKIGRRKGTDLHIEWRIHTLLWAAGQAVKLGGDFVECGVNTGIFSLAICEYLKFNTLDKHFYLFDTFAGIPKEQVNETERNLGRMSRLNNLYEECFEVAKRNFAEFPRAVLVQGRVPDTLTKAPISEVCFLSIDMNIVEPEIAAIEYFWPRLSAGAPVILDDYGWDAHIPQRLAMDAFAESKGVSILELPTGQGMLIKPPN